MRGIDEVETKDTIPKIKAQFCWRIPSVFTCGWRLIVLSANCASGREISQDRGCKYSMNIRISPFTIPEKISFIVPRSPFGIFLGLFHIHVEKYKRAALPRHEQDAIPQRSQFPYCAVRMPYIRPRSRCVCTQGFYIVVDLIELDTDAFVIRLAKCFKNSETGSLPALSR